MNRSNQGQFQLQREVQIQKLSPQQYLLANLIELPITDLEQRVRDEVYENIALEEGRDSAEDTDENRDPDLDVSDEFAPEDNHDDDWQETDSSSLYDEDDLPTYTSRSGNEPNTEVPIGDTRSFIDDLRAQIADYEVDEHQRVLIDYLIGSLDDRGFVDRPLRNIADDLLFNHNIETNEQELEEALHILQRFDPVGIGARNLQECLLLQIHHQQELLEADESLDEDHYQHRLSLLQLEAKILTEQFSLFEHNDVERMVTALKVSPDRLRHALKGISKLNPTPGRSLHEAADDRAQTIIPDFIIETDRESSISFTLNNGEIPALHVSREYLDQLKHYQRQNTQQLSRTQRDAFIYTKQKVEAAQMFISAIKQRQHTLTSTMRAIIEAQRPFMLTQDEQLLKPLRLADVAEHTGLNISTVSRVINSKYALLDGVLYPLKYFFLRTKANAKGEAVLRNRIYPILQDIINSENKNEPWSDAQLSELLSQRGESISRRTVAKYRDEMGIPAAAFRKRL